MRNRPVRSRPLVEELEPRILYSADAFAGLLHDDAFGAQAEVRVLEPPPAAPASSVATPQDARSEQARSNELVFIDQRVPDYQTLVDDLISQKDGSRQVEIFLLDPNRDGVEQISQVLAQHHDISAVHLISHGADGSVQLGGGALNFDTLIKQATQIKGWSNALTEDADLLIYGCDVAQQTAGKALVDALARLTGADVAASTDLTGQLRLGGNWNLEYRSGQVDTRMAIDSSMQEDWAGVLAITANGTATSAKTDSGTSLTWSHTVASGSNTALFVELAIDGLGANTSSVTYGGVAMTQVGRSTGNHAVEIWILKAPTVGTANIIATFAASTPAAGGATAFDGVNQSTPTGTFVGATGTGTTASATVTSAVGDLVIDAEYWKGTASGYAIGAGQTQQWTQTNTSNVGKATTESGAASVTMSSSVTSSAQWEIGAVSIKAAVNSAPTITNGATVTLTGTNEDTTSSGTTVNTILTGASWADADGGASKGIAITSKAGNGTWQYSTDGVTWAGFGSVSASNALLLSSTTQVRYVPDGLNGETATFGFKAWDQSAGAASTNATPSYATTASSGGTTAFSSQSATSSITISALNDAPTLGNGTLAAVNEDTANPAGQTVSTIFTGQFADVDAGASFSGIAVVGNSANASTQGAWQYSTNGGSNWFAIGTVADGATALALSNSTLVRFVPVADYNGAPTALVVRGLDNTYVGGFSSTAGSQTRVNVNTTTNGGTTAIAAATASLSTSITAVNDPPINTLAGDGSVMPEDTAVQLLNSVVIADVDGGAGSYTVTLSINAAAGTLSAVSGSGVTVSGTGTATLVLTGTLSSINNYFAAPATAPLYTPVADYNGPVSVTLVTNDNGNAGSGGAMSDSDTANGTISAVADIADDSAATNEDTPVTFSPLSNDTFENAGRVITHINGTSISTGGSVAVTGGAVTLNAGGTLTFAPTANYNGTPSFTYTVASGGATETATVSVTVTAVNDAPAGADKTVTTLEDTTYTFTAADFGITDSSDSPANTLLATKVTGLPTTGGLTLSGVAVTAGQTISIANISSGNLKFTPPGNANGAGYASLTFQVQDNGGTANGGVDFDPTPNTLTINVTAVNDAPIRTAGTVANLTVPEDSGFTSLGFGGVAYGPGGGADESGQTLSYAVTALPSSSIGNVFLADGTTQVTLSSYTLAEIRGMQFKPTANASGVTAFQYNVTDSGGTANGGSNGISEFVLITVNAVNDPPIIANLSGDSLAYNEGDAAVVIEQGGNASVTDVDSADFSGGTLTVSFQAGSDSAEDVLAIRNQGTGAGQIGVSGANVSYGGVTIGTYTGGAAGANLVVAFNASATPAAATALVKSITFQDTDTDAPTTSARTVRFVLTDGDGGTSANYDATVTVTEVNDAPANTVPGAQITDEDTAKVFSAANGNQISITDADAGGANNEVTLSVTNGTLTLAGTAGLTFTSGDGTADATMTLRGTAAAINTALDGLAYVPTANYSGSATLTITTLDSTLVSLNVDASLRGCYTFDSAADLGNDTSPAGTSDGTVSGANSVVDGTRGNVLSLDGNSYVQFAGNFGNPANVTVAAWVNATSLDPNGAMIIALSGAQIKLSPWGTLEGWVYSGSGWEGLADLGAANLNGTGWHHVAFSFNDTGNAYSLYLDGMSVASGTTTTSISYSLAPESFIGKAPIANFTGNIDDARIYNRALTAAEIAALASDLSMTDTDKVSITVTAVNDAPVITPIAPDPTFIEGGLPQLIDATGTITDADSTNFDGGALIVSVTANGSADDRLMVGNWGSGPGQVGVSGSNVTYEGTAIGTVSGGTNGDALVVSFNTSASAAAVQEVYRSIQFDNSSDAPSTATREIYIELSDGDGGAADPRIKLVYVQAINDPPVLAFGEGDKSFTEGAAAVMIDAATTVSDVDSPNFDTGTLTVTTSANATADDRVELLNTGMGAGQIGVSGVSVYYGGVQIGTQGGGVGTSPFVVTFNSNANAAIVQEVMRNIRFWVAGDAPSPATRTVDVVLTDGDGGTSATASKQISVVAQNDAPSGLPTIGGTPTEDQTLSADVSGIGDADGLGLFSYQWTRNGSAIGGATASTYTLGDADVGANLRVVVSYTDGGGTAESVASAPTAAVANVNDAPTGSVTIDDTTPTQGQTLTASNTLADADGLGTISYQWQRGGVDIAGATGATYTTTQADVGATLRVIASYTDGQGTAESVASVPTAAVTNVNDAPTGSVSIDDTTPTQGQTLTASNTLADADVLGTVSYQWQRGGVDIAGATGVTYTTSQTDVGAALRVIASYTDGQGTAESVASADTSAVTNLNDAPTGSVTIDDTTPTQGQTLTASNTLADADGMGTVSYQWQRGGVDIAGATGATYTTSQTDVGATLRVIASYTDGQGTAESVASAATAAVSNVNDLPTGSVTIDDTTPTQRQTLTASNTLADADGLGTISYQWQRGGVDIVGATGATYTTSQTDVGATLRVIASYTDGQGTGESVASVPTAAVANVNDAPTGSVTIDDTTPTQGQTLTASNTLVDVDGLGTISYQWQRGGVDIVGATGATYTTTQADVGAALRVIASYTDGQGTAESVASAPTAAVSNVNDLPTGSVTIDDTTPTQGQTLTASNTLVDADGLGAISYQWQRGGVDIVGATGATYITTQTDVGATLRVIAKYTDGQGTAESVASVPTAAVANVNDAPTGSVIIDDTTPTQGQTLTASNSLADADGLGTVSYQWQRGGVDIVGATGATYTTTQADVGAALRVIASYTDGQGTAESVASADTSTVTNLNDPPTGSVTIDDTTPTQGQTLTASNTLVDADGLGTISYQWQRGGVDIAGATGATYTTSQTDVGAALRVIASYTDGQGTAESVASAPTAAVSNVNDAPTGSVIIDDTTPTQGQTLTASNTLADADGLGTISYQWQRGGVDIAGATGATYTATQADVGQTLTAVASYTDGQGTAESVASAATAAVTNVNDAPTGSVTIDDTTPAQGQTLTASNTLADADGMGTVSYQWQRGGVDIAGATGATYTTSQTDVGAALRVIASYTDGQGTAESVASAPTAAVSNVNDAPTGSVIIDDTTPTQGQTLTASNTLADADGLGAISYQWQRGGVDIAGATGATYTTTQADVGAALRVIASYTDGQGTAESVASAATAAVTNVNDAPTGSVTIDDTTPAQGQTLTASNTLADADGMGTVSYQWQRGGVDIAGATGVTYTTSQTDVGATLRVIASYTDGQGTAESVASAATAAVTNVNDAPILTGTGGALTYTENDPATAVDGGLTVSDVDSPTLAGATIQITSNYANGQDVLSFVNQLGISGNWNAGTGTLTLSGSATLADYQTALRSVGYSNATDSPSLLTRTVSFSVSDGAASSASVVRNINLVAVNDAPAIAANAALTVNEGSLGNVISTAMLNEGDPDDAGAGLSYTVTANVAHGSLRLGGALLNVNDSFTQADIDAGRVSYDHDGSETTGDSFGFRLADGGEDGAGTVGGTFTITVTPQNGAPTITSNGGGNSAAISIAENGSAVTVVTATDPDLPPDALSYSIVGGADAARFAIDANTGALTFIAAPDFENPTDAGLDNVYDVVVQVSDGSLVDSQAIAVTVTDVGESSVGSVSDVSPAFDEVAENAVAGTPVGITAHAADPDAMDSVTYSLDNDAGGRFAIDAASGVVSVAGPIDREAAASYGIVVRATSSDASFSTAGFTIGVLPVNEFAPAITSDGGGASASISVADNSTAVTNVMASDADLPAQTLAYSIAGGADASRFVIDVGTGALRFVAPPSHATPTDSNADNIYQVIVSVSDGSFSDTQAIDVTVQPPGNAPPVITSNGGGASASIGVAENTTAVTTVSASDSDMPAQTLAYSIAGGADGAKFTIDAATGVLSFVTAPDFEAPTDAGGDNIYDVIVQVSDGSLSDSQAISVAVSNVAEGSPGILVTPVAGLTTSEAGGSAQFSVVLTSAPTANVRIGVSVSDDTEGVASIGTLEFTAANWNVAQIVTVVGIDDAAVDGDVGYFVILAPATSSDAAYNGLDGADVAVVNRDNDVTNTAPVITSDGGGVRATINVDENATAVTTVRATDTDVPAQTISYSIAGGADAAKFSIDARTGELSFLDAPDFEMPADAGADNQYDVTVTASDGQGGSDTQDIRVAVGDVKEAPVLDLPSATALYVENAEPLAIAPDALLGNPDASGFGGGRLVVSISLNGEAGDRLAIANQGTGAGQIGVSGGSVTFGGEVIGTWSGGAGGASASKPLVVAFNAKASTAAVQAVARSITFETVSEAPSALARSVDLVVENSGGLASKGASVAVSVQPVDDAPVMERATLRLRFGETVTLGTANVLGSDVDSPSASLRFSVSGVTNGWFEATGRPGAAISSFSLDELQSGGVRFVHSGKGMAPTFQVAISDGDSSSKPMLAAVTFEGPLNPGGGGTDSGGGGSGGSGSGGSGTGGTDSGGGGKEVKPVAPVSPTPGTSPAEKPAAQPAVSGGAETPLFNPLVEAPSPGVRGNGLDQVLSASVQMPAIEPGATAVARVTLIDSERLSAILISEGLNNGDFDLRLVSVAQAAAPAREAPPQAIEVEPAPVEQVAPEVVVNEITVSAAEAVGLSLTVGMVWWALRLGGLLASAMVSVPAWRQVDLLPILDDQGDRDWDADDDRDDGSDDQAAEDVFATLTGGREP